MQICKSPVTGGGQVTYINRGHSVTLSVIAEGESREAAEVLGLDAEQTAETFTIPRQPNFPPAGGVVKNDVIVFPVGSAFSRYVQHWKDESSCEAVYRLYTVRTQPRRLGLQS